LDTIPSVTDRQTDRQTRCRIKDAAYYVATRAGNDGRACRHVFTVWAKPAMATIATRRSLSNPYSLTGVERSNA